MVEAASTPTIEVSAVMSLQDSETISLAVLRGVMGDDFAFTPARNAYNWILEYHREYAEAPTHDVVLDRFPELRNRESLTGTPEYFFDKVKELSASRRVRSVLEENIEHNLTEDPMTFIDEIMYEFGQIRTRSSKHIYGHGTDDDALVRLGAFDQRREELRQNLGVIGIRSGIATIDAGGLGFVGGDLVGIIARPYIGKTWMLIRLGVEAWKMGKRVLLISSEMEAMWMELRLDVMLGRELGYDMSYTDLQKATGSREEYERFLEEIQNTKRWFTYDSYQGESFTPERISALVDLHKVDMVLVDGVYNVRNARKVEIDHTVVARTMLELKNLAVRNRCVVAFTAQANRGASDLDRPPKMAEVAHSDAINQYSDIIMTACLHGQDELKRIIDRQKWRNLGQDSFRPIELIFDVNRGLIVDSLSVADPGV